MEPSSYFYLIITIILLCLSDNLSGQATPSDHTGQGGLTEVLFGNLWKFNQYCGYQRTDDEILQDDLNIQALHNGTSVATSYEQYDHLLQVGIKAKQALPMICSVASWGYADHTTELASNDDHDDQEENCKMSLEVHLAAPTFEQFRATSSWARVPAGHLFGQNIWLGDHDDCLRPERQSNKKPTRYCFGALTRRPQTKSISPNVNGFRVGFCAPRGCTSRAILEQVDYLDGTFRRSNGLEGNSSMSRVLGDYKFTDVYCPPLENSLNRRMPGDYLSVSIYILASVWLSMLIYGTLVACFTDRDVPDNNNNKSLATIIRKVFDLRRNWTELFDLSKRGGGGTTRKMKSKEEEEEQKEDSQQVVKSDELAGLNGVKVIAMNWLMLSHIYGLMTSYSINTFYDDNGHEWSRWDRHQIIRALIYQGQHLPPGFFLISGLLAARKYLAAGPTGGQHTKATTGKINAIKMILLRYIRLVPMYLIAYTFVKKFGHLLGSGPLWDYGVSVQSETRQCQLESWLVPLLMISNFIPPFSHCIITGWHISNDFQIYLVLPFLLLIYKKGLSLLGYPAGRLLALLVFIITHLSHVYNWHSATNFAFEQVAREPFLFGSSLVVGRMAFDYVNPLGRIGTYFLGVVLGEFLFSFKQKSSAPKSTGKKNVQTSEGKNSQNQLLSELVENIKNDGHSPVVLSDKEEGNSFKATLTFLVGAVLFLTSMVSVVAPDDVKFLLGPQSKTIAYPLVRLIAELGWASMLVGLLRGRAWASNWLRWPVWDQLIKLNYTIMLLHFTVARQVVLTQRQLFVFNYTNYFQLATFVILLTYVISLMVHLSIEMPLNKLIRLYLIKKINRLCG